MYDFLNGNPEIKVSPEFKVLWNVFAAAVSQSENGKGAERHKTAEKQKFTDQLIYKFSDYTGDIGFQLGQSVKKITEALKMFDNGADVDRVITELLGSLVYTGAVCAYLSSLNNPLRKECPYGEFEKSAFGKYMGKPEEVSDSDDSDTDSDGDNRNLCLGCISCDNLEQFGYANCGDCDCRECEDNAYTFLRSEAREDDEDDADNEDNEDDREVVHCDECNCSSCCEEQAAKQEDSEQKVEKKSESNKKDSLEFPSYLDFYNHYHDLMDKLQEITESINSDRKALADMEGQHKTDKITYLLTTRFLDDKFKERDKVIEEIRMLKNGCI